MEEIKKILIERGYPERIAATTAANLSKLTGRFGDALKQWVQKGANTVMESHGYTTTSLMERFKGMTYPAALLTIDWLERDPKMAKQAIEKGIR